VLEAKPIYATVSWSDFISALYTIDLIKHFPIKGQLFFPQQLYIYIKGIMTGNGVYLNKSLVTHCPLPAWTMMNLDNVKSFMINCMNRID